MKMLNHLLIFFVFALVSFGASASFKTLVAPINKDATTSLYTITLNSNNPYVIELNAPFSWFVCERPYPPVPCRSPQCAQGRTYLSSLCNPPPPNNNKHRPCSCIVTSANPVAKTCAAGQLTYDDLSLSWTNGMNPTGGVTFNKTFVSCAPKTLLQGLPANALGIAGLSWAPLALSTQFAPPSLGLAKKFAICLPSAAGVRGAIFFGDGPYYLRPRFDATAALWYTPLLRKKSSPEYYIGIQGISINGKAMYLGSTASELSNEGVKLSTVVPYTTLRSELYNAFLNEFSKATKGIPRAKTVSPFGLCLKTGAIGWDRPGLMVPQIDLVVGSGKKWTIYGTNSMKQVGKDVACFAFIDGGKTVEDAVVIVGYLI